MVLRVKTSVSRVKHWINDPFGIVAMNDGAFYG